MRLLIVIALLAGLVWWLRKRFIQPPAPARNTPSASLSIAEARDILGVAPTASREEIVNAHRKLMQKVHPDVGGTNYLAQQLNEAKRVLLEHRSGH